MSSSPTTSFCSPSTSSSTATSALASPVDALFSGAHCQRLLKLRHQDMDKMEIKTKTLSASMNYDQTRFTVYKLAIQSSVRHGGHASDWLLEKRYSEFFFFRRDVLRLIRAWESALGGAHKTSGAAPPREFVLACSVLREPLAAKFPRKHMRCDTKEIVRQRRDGLTDFVRKLLAAYADISVFLYNNTHATTESTPAFATLKAIFLQLEAFLCVPDAQKDEERRQADAILALDDVDDAEHTCCICLDDNSAAHDDSPVPTCGAQVPTTSCSGDKMVQLPCRHQFHEDCIIDWFNASTTCPLCRRPAFKECPRIFDVTMRELTEL